MAEPVIWGIHIRTESGNRLFLERGFIAIGWPEIGDLSKIAPERDSFKSTVSQKSPGKSNPYIGITTGQLFRFTVEMKPDDWIVYRATYFDGQVHIGKIIAGYRYEPSWLPDYPNVRQVQWLKALPPTRFTQGALYELGAAMTLFQLRNYGDEYISAIETGHPSEPAPADDETVALVAEDIEQNTQDFILKELQHQIKGHKMQGFVADLLRTMGYRTTESKAGPDEGVDIVAHRDELRLIPPIVKVQVKSGDGNISRDAVQSLIGNLGNGEYGLFVTISGFTNQARDFARTRNNIRLIDGPALVQIIIEHYEDLQPGYKGLIPLKKVYIPQPISDSAE